MLSNIPHLKPSRPKRSVAGGTFGIIGVVFVLIILATLGYKYTEDCRAAGGEFEQCWDKGLEISGMNPGGPLSAAVMIGYLIGNAGKEKEKAEKYQEGYWTRNPELHKEDDLPKEP